MAIVIHWDSSCHRFSRSFVNSGCPFPTKWPFKQNCYGPQVSKVSLLWLLLGLTHTCPILLRAVPQKPGFYPTTSSCEFAYQVARWLSSPVLRLTNGSESVAPLNPSTPGNLLKMWNQCLTRPPDSCVWKVMKKAPFNSLVHWRKEAE